jgi:DNA-binding HxlR family transcriptional regulator
VTGGCPCFYTTTTKQVEEQYASRNWLGHIDTSRLQTIGIHHEQYVADALPEGFNLEQKDRTEFLTHVIRWLLQNSKPVLVPFRYSFSKDPRSRRERPKFQMLIKAACNLYQLRRKSVQFKNKTYLIAEIEDFEIALKIAEPFLRSTVMTLDKHALAVIDHFKTLKVNESATTKELLAAIDIKHATLQRRLQYLERQGFVEFAAEPKRGTPTTYRLTEAGRNVSNVEIKITDDGQWIRDLYGKLDDPETNKFTNNAFSRILEQEAAEEKILAESQARDKGLFVKKLHEEAEKETDDEFQKRAAEERRRQLQEEQDDQRG